MPCLKLLLFLTAVCAFCAPGLRAQELMRESLAGADVADTQMAQTEDQNYNLKLGPIRFLLSGSAGVEYVDNINYSNTDRQSDVVTRVAMNLESLWNLTKLNTITVNLGIGFVRYVDHPNATNNNLFITPGSQVSFDLYIADIFRLNFHDSFDLRQDPVDQPTLSGVTDFARFTNTVGVTGVADLNTLVLTLGYDHFNYISLSSDFDYLNRSSEQVLGSAVYQLAPRIFLGVEGTFADTRYDDNVQNDSVGGTGGLYFDITPTPYLRFIARGGYQYASFDKGGEFSSFPYTDNSTLSSFYWNLTVNHRINAYLTENLSSGRENDLGLTSNYLEVNYVRYNVAWRALSNITLGGDGFYENDQESGGLVDEHLERYGGDVTLGYQFNLQLSASAHYAYIKKDSDVDFRKYYQDRVGLDVDYRF